MKLQFDFKGQPVTIDAEAEDIKTAMESAVRGNEEAFKIALDIVGRIMAERMNYEAEKRQALDKAMPKSIRSRRRVKSA